MGLQCDPKQMSQFIYAPHVWHAQEPKERTRGSTLSLRIPPCDVRNTFAIIQKVLRTWVPRTPVGICAKIPYSALQLVATPNK